MTRRPDVSVTWRALPEADLPASSGPQGSFAVGSVLWRDRRGRLVCTVVAKATYELGPGVAAPLDVPLPLQEEEGYWDDDASRSVHVPSDLVPFKSAAEVVVVGSAFAPMQRTAASVTARIRIGSVDKAIEAFQARLFRQNGAVETGPPLARFSLRYEHAARSSENPSGMDVSRVDMWGRMPIPALLPASFTLGAPNDHLPTVGFGPIASTWPSRAGRIGALERAWLRHPTKSPASETLARFFQAAPMDQWLDRPLAPNERIVLEGLHAAHPRLVMSLSGIEPQALLVGADHEPLRLSGDLLFIDTDQGLCTLTFRGHIEIDEGDRDLSVIVVGVPMGTTLSSEAVHRILQEIDDDDTSPSTEAALPLSELPRHILMALAAPPPLDTAETLAAPPPLDAAETLAPGAVHSKPALPFQSAGQRIMDGAPAGADRSAEPVRRVLQMNSDGSLAWKVTSAPADLSAAPSLPLDAGATLAHGAVHAKPALPFRAPSLEPERAASEDEPRAPRSAPGWPEPPQGPMPPAMIGSIELRRADAPPARIAPQEEPGPPPMIGPIEPRRADAPPTQIAPPEEPAPPPMIGPIPIAPASEPLAASPADSPSKPTTAGEPAPEAPAPDPPPIEEPKAPGLPLDKYPLETCAAIAARLAQRPEDEGAILEAEKLSKETWEALHTHWLDAIREDATRGKRQLLSAYDVAYVGALEAERGPITPTEYARLLIAVERGQGEQMLTKLRLPEGVMIRIRRVWLERTMKDPKAAEEVRAAMREA